MAGRIHRGSIVIQEPSMEDLNMRRRSVDDEDRYEKKKSVFQDQKKSFVLRFKLDSAKIINSLHPWPLGSYYIVAWLDPDDRFESSVYEFEGGPPDWDINLETIVEPGWKYLFLEVVQVDGFFNDPESSEHEVVVGRARLRLQNFRPMAPRTYFSSGVSVPLVKVYGEVGGDIRYKLGWEILGHIYTREILCPPARFIATDSL